jgi:UDP-N-acetyl-2-amino-2-deoxyglucuronate dehydrogenase
MQDSTAARRRFAMLGAAGFVAPRHMKAIHETGNVLVAACDPYDGVGVMDRYFPECRFFTEVERFDRHLEKLRRRSPEEAVEYVSVCTPNYLHDAHCRLALRLGADAICEKPLVISPWNLEQLAEIEAESGRRIYNVLQLRLHDNVRRLKQQLEAETHRSKIDIELTYVTRRGPWYHQSWKGNPERSGTLAMNIGIHFFDMLMWLFGPVAENRVHVREETRLAGYMELEWARVKWFLSIEVEDLPPGQLAAGKHAYRGLTFDGQDFDFSSGFDDLHTKVYQNILSGGGYGIADARPSIDVVYEVRSRDLSPIDALAHPRVRGG